MARFVIGEAGVSMMTAVRGSSNAKAKRELGWQPQYGSWREGFRRAFGHTRDEHERARSRQQLR
jgi:hypothetical protein